MKTALRLCVRLVVDKFVLNLYHQGERAALRKLRGFRKKE